MKHLPITAIILAVIAIIVNLGGGGGIQFGATATSTTGSAIEAAAFGVSGMTVINTVGNLAVATATFGGGITVTGTVTASGAATVGTTLGVTGESNIDTLVQGGDKTTPTASGTVVITAAQVCDSALLHWEPILADSSITLPAATEIVADCLTTNGDTKSLLFRNISATAASSTGIYASTGLILLEPDGQNVIVAGGNAAFLRFIRASSTGVIVSIDEMIDAD